MNQQIPILILAGSDRGHGPVPPGLDIGEMLTGFKGSHPLPSGKSLAAELVDRYRTSGRFEDPLVFGPKAIYQGLVDCEIVDVSGNLAGTLQSVQQLIHARWALNTPVAVSACDILPTSTEILNLLASTYDPYPECRFWWQMITAVPQALGASSWKPRYEIRPAHDKEPQVLYPGHLFIFQPNAVRIDLWIRIMTLAYRYRNLPIRKRFLPWLVSGLGTLAAQDWRNLNRGQLPILTLTIPWHILRAYSQFQHTTLTISEFERHLSRVLLHRRYRKHRNAVVIGLTEILSFAKDIDSHQELEAVHTALSSSEIKG